MRLPHTKPVQRSFKAGVAIGAKPNVYREAIELVCGGSSIGCVLVYRKVQHRGKWEQQQLRTSLDQLFVQHKCTAMGKINGNYL